MPEKRSGEFLRGLAWNIPASIGAPADLAETVLNLGLAGGGYLGHKLGLLGADQLPQLLEGSPGTTKWWTKGTPMEESADPAFVRGQLTGGLAAAAYGMLPQMRMRQGQVNAITWHGSPHKFDKFDSSKIGTGEGAQAYGHGLYLAESPDVAQQYQRNLSSRVKSANVGGDVPVGDARGIAHEIATVHKGSVEEFISSNRLHYELAAREASAKGNQRRAEVLLDIMRENDEIAKSFRGKPVVAAPEGGQLYKVDLPDSAIAKMLDWDKPLSQQADRLGHLLADVQDVGKVAAQKVQQLAQQPGVADWARRDLMADAAQLAQSKSPQHVAGVLKRMQLEYGISPDSGPFKQVAPDFLAFVKGMQAVPNMDTGGGAVSYLQARYGEKAASDLLRAHGIPGIRYLDGGSRAAGSGSYNYVVFPGEEGMLRILERNGVPLQQGLAEGPVLQKGLAKP